MCMGGRIFRRRRDAGAGNALEGANDVGLSASCARREGLWSTSLSWLGSYEPSPARLLSARRLRASPRIDGSRRWAARIVVGWRTNLPSRQLEVYRLRIWAPFHDPFTGVGATLRSDGIQGAAVCAWDDVGVGARLMACGSRELVTGLVYGGGRVLRQSVVCLGKVTHGGRGRDYRPCVPNGRMGEVHGDHKGWRNGPPGAGAPRRAVRRQCTRCRLWGRSATCFGLETWCECSQDCAAPTYDNTGVASLTLTRGLIDEHTKLWCLAD